jgi:hypothetical protein
MSAHDRLRELLRDFPAELRDADWRLGPDELPVLRRLPRLELELGDRASSTEEPDPLEAGLRAELARTRDTGPAPESEWWEHAYKGGGPADVLGFPGPLYPPDAPQPTSPDSPLAVATKRTVSRLGRWPWQSFDDTYSNGFAHGKSGNVGETGVAGVQRQQDIQPSGNLGEKTFTTLRYCLVPDEPGFAHGGEQAMDAVACNLIDEAWQRAHEPPAGVDDVRAAVADFCRRSIAATGPWHYEQYRAMRYLGTSPDAYHESDCSEHATEAYYWARKMTGVAVPDPNHSGFNGYGYTGTLVDNPRTSSPYKVGDLAIYGASTGSTEHVCTCYVAGDAGSSVWCSHGSEAAPYAVELYYRGDLLCVVRPPLTP